MHSKKIIGIIGGMGPLATSDLFCKIIMMTDAASDNEHLHILIDNDTDIPDRTDAILSGGTDPTDEILKAALCLQSAGADVLVMPCNTAHYFYDRVSQGLRIPLLNMIEETAEEVQRQGVRRVGLLATTGTLKSRVYHLSLEKRGIEVLQPDEQGQRNVMEIIYDYVKAGKHAEDISGFLNALNALQIRGAESYLLGCTELPLAFAEYKIDRKAIDATSVLACAAIKYAGGKIKQNFY